MKLYNVLICSLGLISSNYCSAEAIEGGTFLVSDQDSDIIVTCLGKNAGYTHNLYLDNNNTFICDSSDEGKEVNIGTFPIGTKLVFRLDVKNSGYSYYSGPAINNPDNVTHVAII
jgi:hypothetical protein